MSQAEAAIRKDCQRLCQVSKSLTEPDEALLAKLLEAMWAHQKSKGQQLFQGRLAERCCLATKRTAPL